MASPTFTMTESHPTSTVTTIPINLHFAIDLSPNISNAGANATTRRRSQNRINQKAARQRQAVKKAKYRQVFDLNPTPPTTDNSSTRESSVYHQDCQPSIMPEENERAEPLRASPEDMLQASGQQYRQTRPFVASSMQTAGPLSPTSNASWCRTMERFLDTHHIVDNMNDPGPDLVVPFEKSFLKNLHPADFFRLPADDHLLSLMYYNVFRALACNIRLLGLDPYEIHVAHYPSPFVLPQNKVTKLNAQLPPQLQPTLLQQTVPHHPCFDVFPDPHLRDQAIRNPHLLGFGMLCMSLAGRNTWFESDRLKRNGMLVWGPPEDASSWEVTEGFLKGFGWLVRGSMIMQESTSRWRAMRGEEPLCFV